MGLSVTKELACGGPFMQGHILRISVLSAPYDGAVILATFPADYDNDVVQIHYNSIGRTLQEERGRYFCDGCSRRSGLGWSNVTYS